MRPSIKNLTGLMRNDAPQGKSRRESGVYTSVHEHFEETFNTAARVLRKSYLSKISAIILIAHLLVACAPVLFVGAAATSVVMVHDRRTTGTIVDDKTIALRTLHEIAKEDFYHQSHVSTVSYNNNVLLVGQVPTRTAKMRVQALAENIPQVRTVYNELTVAPPISLTTRAHDSMLTTKVKARLLASRDINPSRIKVVTENSTVYLMGIVSRQEAEIATKETQKVSGVYKITRLFEYARVETPNIK